jgi:ribose transport system ATP-binding protein
LSVASNIIAPALSEITRSGFLDRAKETDIAQRQIKGFSIAVPSPSTRVGALSGGNQQKVLFSRWARIADCLLLLDEPTRGVDVGAKVEIYRMIRALADEGIAVLMISSELAEVVGLADRVFVMAQGRVSGELTGIDVSEESVMRLAVTSHDPRAEGAVQ